MSLQDGFSVPVTTRAVHVGLDTQFTVYFGELYGLFLTLEILGKPTEYSDTRPVIIYTDNQSAIRNPHCPQSRSGQYVLTKITRLLRLLNRQVEIH